jgi:hypothetical protein
MRNAQFARKDLRDRALQLTLHLKKVGREEQNSRAGSWLGFCVWESLTFICSGCASTGPQGVEQVTAFAQGASAAAYPALTGVVRASPSGLLEIRKI